MIKSKFGAKLKSLRQQRGISQEQFALSIDMDRTYYASVENGKHNISLIYIEKFASGLNISLKELFDGV